jgi:hypothetical protein
MKRTWKCVHCTARHHTVRRPTTQGERNVETGSTGRPEVSTPPHSLTCIDGGSKFGGGFTYGGFQPAVLNHGHTVSTISTIGRGHSCHAPARTAVSPLVSRSTGSSGWSTKVPPRLRQLRKGHSSSAERTGMEMMREDGWLGLTREGLFTASEYCRHAESFSFLSSFEFFLDSLLVYTTKCFNCRRKLLCLSAIFKWVRQWVGYK